MCSSPQYRVFRAAVHACVACAIVLCLWGCGGVQGGAGQASAYNRGVYPPSSAPYGVTYGEWVARWWQWILSTPVGENPIRDTTGAKAAVGQSGPVWFLVNSLGNPRTVERTCTVPAGKAFLMPIAPWIGASPMDGATDRDLIRTVTGYADHVTELEAVLDGVQIKSLFSYRFKSPVFEYTMPPVPDALAPKYAGTHRGFTDGYWIMLEPLSPGPHELKVRGKTVFPGAYPAVTVTEITATYHLTVE